MVTAIVPAGPIRVESLNPLVMSSARGVPTMFRDVRLVVAGAVIPILVGCGRGATSEKPSEVQSVVASTMEPSSPVVPDGVAGLTSLEERLRRASAVAQPAIVAVLQSGQPNGPRHPRHARGGAGVIITPEGLVVTQYHVSHKRDGGKTFDDSLSPGAKTKVVLADGRECAAELLGAIRNEDLAMLRILGPGPFPYAAIEPAPRVELGSWVLKFGHPLGYRRDRPAPMRLGRVVGVTNDGFCTDCLTCMGDSGGPFSDLDGRLVGIMRLGTADLIRLLPKDPIFAERSGPVLKSCTSSPLIQTKVASMERGEMPPYDAAELLEVDNGLASAPNLPTPDWTQGPLVRAAFGTAIGDARAGTVTLLNGDVPIGLGTVVTAEGAIVTKASELPAAPMCRLPDGRVVGVRIVGVDPAFDLALLDVPSDGLRAPSWANSFRPQVGTLVAALGPEGLPIAVGAVSVPRRDLADAAPRSYCLPLRVPAAAPEVFGKERPGQGYLLQLSKGLAWSAGIRPGDILTSFDGKEVRRQADLTSASKAHLTGDLVPVRLNRDGKELELRLPLRSISAYGTNFVSDDFPTVFEHSIPVLVHECGGPVVDLNGKLLGVTIAKTGYGGIAIPGDCIQALLPGLRSGESAGGWGRQSGTSRQ